MPSLPPPLVSRTLRPKRVMLAVVKLVMLLVMVAVVVVVVGRLRAW